MRIFGTIFDVISLPVAVAKDILTMGNIGDTPYTIQEIRRIRHEEELREILKEINKK